MSNFIKKILIISLGMFIFLGFCQSQNLELKYLGCAGWEITDGKTTILIDPYITRLKLGTGPGISEDDDRKSYTKSDYFESDTVLINKTIKKVDSKKRLIFNSRNFPSCNLFDFIPTNLNN